VKQAWRFVLILGTLALPWRAPAPAAAEPALVLDRVIVLQRHGIRPPTKSAADLAPYATQSWPDWPVPPGHLTPHGANAIALLGQSLRQTYAHAGLFPAQGCPAGGSVFLWSDSADQRTRASGDALAGGLFPGCGLTARHLADGATDPLFHPGEAGLCPLDPRRAQEAIGQRIAADPDRFGPAAYAQARTRLRDILVPAPASCGTVPDRRCVLATGTDTVATTPRGAKLDGPLAVGASMSENLLLEYAEGMPLADVGWGRADAATLAEILPLHDLFADLTRRTPLIAAHNGALLARQILAVAEGNTPAGFDHAAPIPATARFVTLLGHDTNLSNLAGILNISWTLPGQPDQTAPDTALAVEIWRDPQDNARYVRLVVHYQTLAQLRTLAPFDADHPAPHVEVPIPGCGPSGSALCPLPRFHAIVTNALPRDCP
jgi:4-phytase / acid phosphatase